MTNKILEGSFWVGGERIVTQFLQIFLSLTIARLLSPEDYGVLGIVMVFIIISQEFIDSGLGNALIYKNDLDTKDISTVFSFNLAICCILYIIIYMVAIPIENFFDLKGLALYLRVCSLVLFFNSFNVVPTAILKILQEYKKLSIANFSSSILSSLISLVMAFAGFGIWALILQTLLKSIILFICFSFFCKVRPRLDFYVDSFKSLYSYSIKLFSASLLSRIVEQMSSFFIGKQFSPFDLGLYSKATQFASLPNQSIGNIVISVLFPSLSSLKNDREKFNHLFRKCIKVQAIVSFPIYIGLALMADPVITIILGPKWIEVIPLIQILAIGRVFYIVAITNEYGLNALGRSDLFLLQQIIKLIVQSIIIVFAIHFGLMYVVFGLSIYTILQYVITCIVGQKTLQYSFIQQLHDTSLYLIISLLAGFIGYILPLILKMSIWGYLFLSPIVFVLLYSLFLYSRGDFGMILKIKRE